MAQLSSRGGRFPVGDYVVGKQIGSGSFSTVWHARHRVHGTEVAIKEIVTARLNSKLQDSLKSEIVILKKIDHPNIIRLHDMIEESGKIYIILEYCKGGDLSVYIQKHHGKIPEATAKHFMQQLASGLKVLRENNLIHRDLKPQNLLLFANDDKSILKIADFGFARSLQPRGLAETLCGSPLYMAPEIMQLQKYDAKADLWSVGTILYQLLIGKTPYTGSNQIQLLQNILKTELQFPPDIKDISLSCIDLCQKLLRRNPVERLTFEEFFNHPFLCKRLPDESLRNMTPLRVIDGFPLSQENHATNVDESSQEDCLPENSPNGTPLFIRKVPLRSTYGFSLPSKFDGKEFSNASSKTNITSDYRSASLKPEINELDFRVSKGNTKVIDSLELIDQDYVLVSSPPLDASSMMSASKLSNAQSKSGSPLKNHGSAKNTTTAPMPIFGTSASRVNQFEISEICGSAPGTSAGSMDMIDILEQQPRDSVTRIKNLQRCASTISELVNEKIESSKHLEAFSLQLVILSIWKQAFHICHSASDTDKSQTSHRLKEMIDEKVNHNNPKLLGASETRITQDLCSQIDTSFLLEVGHAEELSNLIEPGNTEMPDAMETIYQCALAFGRRGGVDEYMGNNEGAVKLYSKAVILFQFILLEAPVLMSNPPFLPTDSDRLRLRNYIDILNNRLNFSRSEKMAFVKSQIVDAPAEI